MSWLEDCLKEVEDKSKECREWLRVRPCENWSRACFKVETKCDILLNNISESFNKYILEARSKPILTMLEMIRNQLMRRIARKNTELMKARQKGLVLCPKILKKLKKIKELSGDYFPTFAGSARVQVHEKGQQVVEDLEAKTCTCRRWQLTGLPCAHAIAAIYAQNEVPE